MKKQETTRLTITAVFVAILLLQTFVPNIGYVRILPALPAITTIPLTVAIYGSLMGPKAGLFFGFFWGITRLVVAYTQPGDMVSLILFQNILISLVPSILAGFFAGAVAKFFAQKSQAVERLGLVLSGAAASLTNTILVIGLAGLLFAGNASLIKYLGNTSASSSLFVILLSALGLNGIVEAIFTGVLTPVIVIPLKYLLKRV